MYDFISYFFIKILSNLNNKGTIIIKFKDYINIQELKIV
jgi:hypothetical protein